MRENAEVRFRRRSYPSARLAGAAERPILAVDVDGVVVLLDEAEEPAPGLVQHELIDGVTRRVSLVAGESLRRLAAHFDLVWASGWQHLANRHLPRLLGIPELPCLDFAAGASWGSADWKLGPLDAYAKGRPLAWVDDSLDDACFRWAAAREAPTLLVPVDCRRGLEEERVQTLLTWVRPFSPY